MGGAKTRRHRAGAWSSVLGGAVEGGVVTGKGHQAIQYTIKNILKL